MKKIILILFTCLLAFPLQAFAYSYGDPTKEDIAETFKLIKSHLDASPSDWQSTLEAYKVRKSEISSHFGESFAVTLDQNIKNEQKAEFITNYRYVLYLNIDRRFTYAKKDINDYGKAKLLVAKAKGTYDVLKPYIQSKMPNKIQEIETAFDKSLEALGNPGLFGVGEKPLEPEEFDKQTNFILTTLKPIFSYKEAKPSTNEQQKQENTTENKELEKEPTVPSKESNQQPSTTKSEKTTTEKPNQITETETKKEEKSTAVASNETEKESEKESETELVEESNEEIKENQEKEAEKDDGEESALQEVTEQPTEQDDTTVAANNTSIEIAAEASADHAPMERSSKTNPFVTIGVIASVIILGAGGIFFAKRRNFI